MIPSDPFSLLQEYVVSDQLREHCLATGAIMREVAAHQNCDPTLWWTIGVLHDIDYEIVKGDMTRHGLEGADILQRLGVSEEITEAIRRHNHHLFTDHSSPLDLALQAADSISGLIIACALVKGGAIEEVTVRTVKKKMKNKGFAAGCDRERIRIIGDMMDQDLFIEAAINGVQSIWRWPGNE
ncbi:phosphohydrolase [Methanocalculus chunghsingensis]|uniref:Phosphohydrolase n=2 Tax=Methanocalculus chunghsingensis TaxID=156457 RepID=A0A8J7WB96_9EURY|nr:phosphohydrolase [Methanocalculus chunghsingensis]